MGHNGIYYLIQSLQTNFGNYKALLCCIMCIFIFCGLLVKTIFIVLMSVVVSMLATCMGARHLIAMSVEQM